MARLDCLYLSWAVFHGVVLWNQSRPFFATSSVHAVPSESAHRHSSRRAGVSATRAGRGVGETPTTGHFAPPGGLTNDWALCRSFAREAVKAARIACSSNSSSRFAVSSSRRSCINICNSAMTHCSIMSSFVAGRVLLPNAAAIGTDVFCIICFDRARRIC